MPERNSVGTTRRMCGAGPISRKAMYFFQRANQPIILVEQDEDKLRRALLYLDPDYL